MLRCADDSLYTGISTDVSRRLRQHTAGSGGAKYLQGRAPLKLVFEQTIGNRSAASRVEYRIKQLSKAEKERLLLSHARLSERITEFLAEPVNRES